MEENGTVTLKTSGFDAARGENDIIEITSRALIREEGSALIIDYDESELTGLEGIHTSLKLDGDCMILSRSGKMTYTMLFEKGKRLVSPYDTGVGILQLSVTTHDLQHQRRGRVGRITAEYSLEMNNNGIGHGIVHIVYRLDADPAADPAAENE